MAEGNSGPRPGRRTPAQMCLMQAGTLPGALLPALESASHGRLRLCLSAKPPLCLHSSNTQHLSKALSWARCWEHRQDQHPRPPALFPQD